jgi:hypothetical protein
MILYYIILYYTILYYILYYIVWYYIILYDTILCYMILYYILNIIYTLYIILYYILYIFFLIYIADIQVFIYITGNYILLLPSVFHWDQLPEGLGIIYTVHLCNLRLRESRSRRPRGNPNDVGNGEQECH